MKLDCQGIFIGNYTFSLADLIYVTMRLHLCDVKREMINSRKKKKTPVKLITCRIIASLKAQQNGFTMLYNVILHEPIITKKREK